MTTKLSLPMLVLTLLIAFAGTTHAKVDTVLRVIPTDAVGWVKVNDLADLIEKVDSVMRKVAPPGEEIPEGILLQALNELLPIPEVNSVPALEALGFDAHRDCGAFWLGASFQKPLIAVHVKNKAEVEATLQSKGNFVDAEYQAISYQRSDAAAFVVLDDVLVYAASEADLQKCIETHLKGNPSLLEDPNSINLDAKWKSETNILIGYVALHKVAATYLPMLKVLPGETTDNPMARLGTWLMEQLQSVSAAVAFDTQGATLDLFMGFKDDSPIQSFLTQVPQSLELVHFLPKDGSMAGGMTLDAKVTEQMLTVLLDILKPSNLDIPESVVEEIKEKFIRSTVDFMAPLGSEAAFAVQGGTGMIPSVVHVYTVNHEKAARDYMADYASHLGEMMDIYKIMGLTDIADALSQIQPGPEEEYEGVRIQSIQLMKELPLPIPNLPQFPQQSMSLWYAFQSDKLLMSFGSDSTAIKRTLDVLAGKADGLNRARSFETVHSRLHQESNFSIYLAPLGFFKWLSQMGAPFFPAEALANVESGIALGVSAAIQDGGITSRMYVSLEEVQQLVAAVSRLNQVVQTSSPSPFGQMRQYREQGELDKMLAYAEERMKNYPHESEMMQDELVRGYQQHKRLDELITLFQEKLETDPTDVHTYKLLGQAFQRNRERVKSLEMYEKAAVLAPNDSSVQRNLGRAYQQQSAHEKATAAYRKALRILGPRRGYERPRIVQEMVQSYLALGDIETVTTVYLQHIKEIESTNSVTTSYSQTTSSSGTTYFGASEVYTGAENFRRNILGRKPRPEDLARLASAFETKLAQSPDDRYVMQMLADIYVGQEKLDKAIEAYDKLTKLVPKDPILFVWLASAQNRAGKSSASLETLEQLEQLPLPTASSRRFGPSRGLHVHNMRLSRIYRWGELYEQAIDAHKAAIGLVNSMDSRSLSSAKKGLAALYREAGKPELAKELETELPEKSRPGQIDLAGKPAPAFALRDLDGKEVKFSDFKGKVVILDFWATWCPPCVKEVPHFVELHKEYQDQDFVMVGISTDRAGVGVVKSFVKKHAVNYPILMADGKVQQAYGGIRSIPTTFVIDKSGIIQKQYVGYRDKAIFEADIKALLAGKGLAGQMIRVERLAFDEFDGKLGLDWQIRNHDPSNVSFTKKPGTLTVTTQVGGFHQSDSGYKNLFLLKSFGGNEDIEVTTCLVAFKPVAKWNQAGLVCFDDEDNYVKWVYQFGETKEVTLLRETAGRSQESRVPIEPEGDRLWLRLTKRGNTYTGSLSTDGKTFRAIAHGSWGETPPKYVGLVAKNSDRFARAPEIDASFDSFAVWALASGEGRDPNLLSLPGAKRLVSTGWKGSWSPDGTRLVFGRPQGKGLQILDLQSGETAELTSSGKDAAWSPDGRFIAYVKEPSSNARQLEEVWLIKPDGQSPRKLIDGGYPHWSADGKTVFVQSRKENKLFAIDVDNPEAEPELFFAGPQSWYPAVSPDGKRIAFGKPDALVIMDRETGETVLKWPTPASRGLLPAWSPDGKQVAFGSFNNNPFGLWVLDVNTQQAFQVAKGRYTMPAWSKDGRKLAFDLRSGTTREVWVVDTKVLTKLTKHRELRVSETQITDAGMTKLKQPLPDIKVNGPGAAVTDKVAASSKVPTAQAELHAEPTIIRIATDRGTLHIATDDTDVEVIVKQAGKEVKLLDPKTGREVTLKVGRDGRFDLESVEGPSGFQLRTDRFTLTRGERIIAEVRLERPPTPRTAAATSERITTEVRSDSVFEADTKALLSGKSQLMSPEPSQPSSLGGPSPRLVGQQETPESLEIEIPDGVPLIHVDLSAHFNPDVILSTGDDENHTLDGQGGLLVEDGYDGVRTGNPQAQGLPSDGRVSIHRLGDYKGLNVLQIRPRDIRPIRVEVPRGRYATLHFLVTGGNGDSRVPITLHYTDGTTQEGLVPCDDWFDDSGDLQPGVIPVLNGLDRIWLGEFQNVNDPALFNVTLTVDSERELEAFVLETAEAIYSNLDNWGAHFNLFAVTGKESIR